MSHPISLAHYNGIVKGTRPATGDDPTQWPHTVYSDWTQFHQTVIQEFSAPHCRPGGVITVAGKAIPQTLWSVLKRLHSKGIRIINDHIRKTQRLERSKNGGRYWTKQRYQTIPLEEDLVFLRYLDELLIKSERWEDVKDTDGLVIQRNLKWRHPFYKDVVKGYLWAHMRKKNAGTQYGGPI
jgi:hypothetical protein